eukprot:1799719-Amphidinium_carterae.1
MKSPQSWPSPLSANRRSGGDLVCTPTRSTSASGTSALGAKSASSASQAGASQRFQLDQVCASPHLSKS